VTLTSGLLRPGAVLKPCLMAPMEPAGSGCCCCLVSRRHKVSRIKPSEIGAFAQMNETGEALGKIGALGIDRKAVTGGNRHDLVELGSRAAEGSATGGPGAACRGEESSSALGSRLRHKPSFGIPGPAQFFWSWNFLGYSADLARRHLTDAAALGLDRTR
jgi:hypothetical protein